MVNSRLLEKSNCVGATVFPRKCELFGDIDDRSQTRIAENRAAIIFCNNSSDACDSKTSRHYS